MLDEFKQFLSKCTEDKNFYKLEGVQGMFTRIKETHLFCVSDDEDLYSNLKDIQEVNNLTNIPEDLDLPFENCFIQGHFENNITVDDFHASMTGLYVYEIAPKHWRIIALHRFESKDFPTYELPIAFSIQNGKVGVGYSPVQSVYHRMVNVTVMWLNLIMKLFRKRWTVIDNTEQMKLTTRDLKRNVVKYKYKPSDIIYLCNEHNFKSNYPSLTHRIISKPKYSYEVMGHWRQLNEAQIGKDRAGVRGVKGYTWVIPHVRGEGDLMKKIRVIS